jgi:hypothetical protein
MTKLFSGAPINYGPLLPPATALSNGALFFKTKFDPDGVSNEPGLYVYSFVGDSNVGSVGDQVGFGWVLTSRLSSYVARDGSLPMSGMLSIVPGNSPGVRISSTSPGIRLTETDQPLNGKDWLVVADAGVFQIQTRPDDFATSSSVLKLTRAGELRILDQLVWHAGNDGDGSTLDADLLDGLHAADFIQRSTLNDPIGDPWSIPLNTRTAGTLGISRGGTNMTTVTTNGIVYAASGTSLTTTAGTNGQMLITNASGVPTWATVSSVVSSNAASITSGAGNMTFSWTPVASGQPTRVWGSDDGLTTKSWTTTSLVVGDSAKLGGNSPDTTESNNTVAVRTAAGDLEARYFKMHVYDSENPVVGQFVVGVTGDGNLRRASVAHVAAALGLSSFLAKSGDTMSGALNMGTNKITNLGTPTVSTDAATMGYVDLAIPTWIATNPPSIIADSARRTPIVQTDISRELRPTDAGCMIYVFGSSTQYLQTDAQTTAGFGSAIPNGTIISMTSVVNTTIAVSNGVTILHVGVDTYTGHTFTLSNVAQVTFVKFGPNSWSISGTGIT